MSQDDSYKKILDQEGISSLGVTLHGKKIKETGEFRAALRTEDGSSVGYTEVSKQGGWQNAHFHKATREGIYIKKGFVVLATLNDDNSLSTKRYGTGEFFKVDPGIIHNVFTSGGALILSMKDNVLPERYENKDWYEHPECDSLTKALKIKG